MRGEIKINVALTEEKGLEVSDMSMWGRRTSYPVREIRYFTHNMIGYYVPGNPIGQPVLHHNCAFTKRSLESMYSH